MNRNKKLISKKKAVVTAMAGVLAIGGIMGASAFFTDQAHTDAKAHIGGLNMVVKDLSDLDGDYSKWTITDDTITENDSVIDTAVGVDTVNGTMPNQTDRVGGNVTGRVVETVIIKDQGDQTSEKIINPGDSGLLQFNVENVDSKSFRTAMKTSVVVSLADVAKEPDGTSATLQAAHKAGDAYAIADYDAYTIEGMGAPLVKFGTYDADTGVFTEAADDDAKAKATAMRLTYYTELDTLKGDVEDEASDGVKDSLTYAFETKFNRLAQNKFMGATIDIKSDFYALQNRKTAGTWYSVTEATDAVDNTRVDATGDWKQIGSFEKVINVVDGKAADLCENATSGMWYVG